MALFGFSRQDAHLIWYLGRNQIRDRYLGSVMGISWAVIQPLLILGMYVFIFGFVFRARIPGSERTLAYAIWLISGYLPYLAISDAVTATANSVVGGSNLVKNVVFKVECLPLSALFSSLVPFAVGIVFLLCLLYADGNYPSWHICLLAVLLVVQYLFLAGIGFFLGALTVFLRDIIYALQSLLMLVLFFTPIFYSVDMLPARIRPLVWFNPLYQITDGFRRILLQHDVPNWAGLAYCTALGLLCFWLGSKFFRKLKGYFESAL